MRMHSQNEGTHHILLILKHLCWEEHIKLEEDACQMRNLSMGELMQQSTFRFKL